MNNEIGTQNFKFKGLLLIAAIIVIAMIMVQNLQPLVTIFFLGQSTIPIPLSVAMLAAFVSGGLSAFFVNLIANWLHGRAIAAIANSRSYPPDDEDDDDEDLGNDEVNKERTRRDRPSETSNFNTTYDAYNQSTGSQATSDRYAEFDEDDEDTLEYPPSNFQRSNDDDDEDDDIIDLKYIR